MTEPCANFAEFAKEVGVLRNELDKMEKEAKERFSAKSPNWRQGFETPQIVTPLELFKERNDV